MEHGLEHLKRDLAGLRQGAPLWHCWTASRWTITALTPLKQVSRISGRPKPASSPCNRGNKIIGEAQEGDCASDLGLTPSNDGKLIRIPLPPLTEERRKELIKVCKKHGEDVKVQIRAFCRDATMS
ncbi:MAG: ribosome recycling factor [Nitrospiraceae bacterium]